MKIYNYHPEYKHFISEGLADPSPLDPPGVWLIPAHATIIEPPEYSDGFIPVFNGNSWDIVEDKRGVYYSTLSKDVVINYNSLEVSEELTKEPPPEVSEGKILKWDNGWILEDVPSLSELTPEEKLKRSGLTVEELKELLGLG